MTASAKTTVEPAAAPKIIWTAAGIGRAIGCSADFVRTTLLDMPNSPVHRMGNRYWAYEDDLHDFFRRLALKKPT